MSNYAENYATNNAIQRLATGIVVRTEAAIRRGIDAAIGSQEWTLDEIRDRLTRTCRGGMDCYYMDGQIIAKIDAPTMMETPGLEVSAGWRMWSLGD